VHPGSCNGSDSLENRVPAIDWFEISFARTIAPLRTRIESRRTLG